MLRFAQHDRIEFFHEYHDAVNDLRNARKHLEKALNDGCGRRDRAMRAIDAAIHECDEAVAAMH